MDTAETTDVNANTRNNNKMVWKNVTVVDDVSGQKKMKSVLLRNFFDAPVQVGLRFAETETAAGSFFKQGRVFVDLTPQLFERWRRASRRPGNEGSARRGQDRPRRNPFSRRLDPEYPAQSQ